MTITKLWIGNFVTASSLAVRSMLLNVKKVENNNEMIFLEYLNEYLYDLFSEALRGGFVCNFG